MRPLYSLTFWLAAANLGAAYADEPPALAYGVYSEASRASSEVVARGSNILIFSFGVPEGPAIRAAAAAFPLATSLAGTSVRVTIGSSAVDAYVLAAETLWVRALVPSYAPLGDGSLVVTYNGQAGVPHRIRIVERQFAIDDGSWCDPSSDPQPPGFCVPRGVQNINPAGDVAANSLVTPARPGQLVTLWGTGLGVVPGDEAGAPIPGNLEIPGLQVLVGNLPGKIIYSGRSGCCAGMDEIIFEVPAGMEGCNVPVSVRFGEDGSATSDMYVAIASGDGACSDPQGLSEAEVRKLSAGSLRVAEFSLISGQWSAAFGAGSQTAVIPFGACRGWGGGFTVDLAPGSFEDAGSMLNLQAPGGNFSALRTAGALYSGPFAEGQPAPGDYTIDNGTGGSEVKPFQAQFSIPAQNFAWTNRDDLTNRPWSEGVSVTWSGADPNTGYILIFGSLGTDGETSGSSFFGCSERADKGSFTIPAVILQRAGLGSGDFNEFRLTVAYLFSKRVSISDIDYAEVVSFGPGIAQTVDPRSFPPARP